MKNILTLIICIIALSTFGQATKEVKKKHKNPYYTERYFVLKSNNTVKHGVYKKNGYKNCLVIDGYYTNNLKDSLWSTYYWRSEQLKKQGSYEDDVRIGEWSFFSSDGTLIQTYDFTKEEVVYSVKSEDESTILENETESKKMLISDPQYIGSSVELNEYLSKGQLDLMKKNGSTGTVVISFFISEDGKAMKHKIESGISDNFDQKCLELVKTIPELWVPGKDESGNVTAKTSINFNFRVR